MNDRSLVRKQIIQSHNGIYSFNEVTLRIGHYSVDNTFENAVLTATCLKLKNGQKRKIQTSSTCFLLL